MAAMVGLLYLVQQAQVTPEEVEAGLMLPPMVAPVVPVSYLFVTQTHMQQQQQQPIWRPGILL